MRQSFKKIVMFGSILTFVIAAVGCQSSTVTINQDDVVTQKTIESGRTPITVLVKYAFTINNFEKIVEEKFPDIDIVQVGNYSTDRGIEEYAARIEHDDLTDIVMTWPLDIGEEYWEDRLIDLSGMSFSSDYNTSMLDSIEKDGKLYYLPGPSQIRGIVYNKTLFQENGWVVPDSYEGFVDLCKTIEASGIRSLQLGFENSEVLDTAFVGYNYGDSYSKPFNVSWIEQYNDGKGSFGDNFSNAIDTFQEMIAAGVFKESDLDIDYSEREELFFNRKCAMIEDSVLMAQMGESYNGNTDELALMPFFNKGIDGDWARLYMVCYIGLNKHLEEEKNKDKYKLVKKLMEYISTPEGQEALASDTGGMFSSIKDSAVPSIPAIKDLTSALEGGRYAVFPELERCQNALRDGLAELLQGKITKEQLIKLVDENNQTPTVIEPSEVIGQAVSSFTLMQTGQYITDVLQKESNCELALLLDNGKDGLYNGKGINGSFYVGDITLNDIKRIFQDLKSGDKGLLSTATITGKDLITALEYSVKVENNKAGWFYYFSGLKMEFDPTAKPGKRIKSIALADGSKIDDDKEYTVAFMDGSIDEKLLTNIVETKETIKDIVIEAIKDKERISPSKVQRFTIVK